MALAPQFNFRDMVAPLARGGSGDPQRDAVSIHSALKRAQDWLNALRQGLLDVQSSVAAIQTTALNVSIKHHVLVANLVIGFPSDPAGTLLLYIFEQDVAGLHTVTWPAGFRVPLPPEPTAETVSTQMFYKKSEALIYPVLTGIGGIDIS